MNLEILERVPTEDQLAYQLCQLYLKLDPVDRTRYQVWKASKGAVSLAKIERMARDYHWDERARAYDSKMAAAHLEGRARAAQRTAERWEARRLEAAEATWEAAMMLVDRAKEMVSAPLWEESVEVCNEKGEPIRTVIKPAGWNIATAAGFFKIAAELQEAAIADGMAIADDEQFDPSSATPQEAIRYLIRKGL